MVGEYGYPQRNLSKIEDGMLKIISQPPTYQDYSESAYQTVNKVDLSQFKYINFDLVSNPYNFLLEISINNYDTTLFRQQGLNSVFYLNNSSGKQKIDLTNIKNWLGNNLYILLVCGQGANYVNINNIYLSKD